MTARQQKAKQSWETEFELSSGPKSVCMRSFNNVNSSCILIQIEVYQAGKGELRKKRHGVSSHSRPSRAEQKIKTVILPRSLILIPEADQCDCGFKFLDPGKCDLRSSVSYDHSAMIIASEKEFD